MVHLFPSSHPAFFVMTRYVSQLYILIIVLCYRSKWRNLAGCGKSATSMKPVYIAERVSLLPRGHESCRKIGGIRRFHDAGADPASRRGRRWLNDRPPRYAARRLSGGFRRPLG